MNVQPCVCVYEGMDLCVCVCVCVCVCMPVYSVCRQSGDRELCVHPPPCTPGASTYLYNHVRFCVLMHMFVHVHDSNYQEGV